MKSRATIWLGLWTAVAICAGYLVLSHTPVLRVVAVQHPIHAESHTPNPMTLQYASRTPDRTINTGIYSDPNFRTVLRALEQRRGPQTLREPEEMREHGVMTVSRSQINRSPMAITFTNGAFVNGFHGMIN